jgi:predicted transcriptional regulator
MNNITDHQVDSKNAAAKLLIADYVGIKEICKRFNFKESTLRYYFKQVPEGFDECAVNWGGRLRIHPDKFVEWANKQFLMAKETKKPFKRKARCKGTTLKMAFERRTQKAAD